MGCGKSSQKEATSAPTLLTGQRGGSKQADKVEPPLLCAVAAATAHAASPHVDGLEVLDVPTAQTVLAAGGSECTSSSSTPGDEGIVQRPLLNTIGNYPATFSLGCEAGVREGQASRIPVDLDASLVEHPPMDSFASSYSAGTSYSAATNFSFGPRLSTPTRSMTPAKNSSLFTLQEDLACESDDAPSWPEKALPVVAKAVEETVHALVDAGEGAWTHARAAWINRWTLTTLEESGEDDEDDLETFPPKRPSRQLPWLCGLLV